MPEHPIKNSPAWQWMLRHRTWLLLSLTLLLVVGVRVRLRGMPLERDEGEYAYAGQLMLQGVAPYKEACNMKLPGTYAAYAVIMAIFGQTPSGIHMGLAIINAASIVLMFFIGRKLLDDATGLAAAMAFGFMSLSPSVLGLAGHATHFVLLPALAGILLLLKACQPRSMKASASNSPKIEPPRSQPNRPPPPGSDALGIAYAISSPKIAETEAPFPPDLKNVFASGLLFGIAFVMKQHGIFFGIFGLIYLLWNHFSYFLQTEIKLPRRQKPRPSPSPKLVLVPLALLTCGLALPYLLTCLILLWSGAFQQFTFWTIDYARQYVSAIPVVNGIDILRSGLRAGDGPGLMFWILPALGAVLMWWERRLSLNYKFLLPTLFVCSAASVSVGFYFREHYFILLLPVLALLAGIAVSRGIFLLRHDNTIELFMALPILGLFIAALGAMLVENGSIWFGLSPVEAVRSTYDSTLFSEAIAASDYLKAHTAKEDRIAVLGSEPEIYFYAHRRSATRFIYMYPLMETQAYAATMQEDMIHEIELARPEYIVFVEDSLSWLQRTNSNRKIYDWWKAQWSSEMDIVKTFDIEGAPLQASPIEAAPAGSDEQRKYLLVLKRKPTSKTAQAVK
jgi:hypothetical protein